MMVAMKVTMMTKVTNSLHAGHSFLTMKAWFPQPVAKLLLKPPSTVGPTPSHVPSAYCPHTHTTAQGSNAFQRRRRCKDCGKLLEVVVLPQGRKASRSSI